MNDSQGTPEQKSLTVKKLADSWIVENSDGESLGESSDRASAVEIAKREAALQSASSISVLNNDGAVEESISV